MSTPVGWDLQIPSPYIFADIHLSNPIWFPPSVEEEGAPT